MNYYDFHENKQQGTDDFPIAFYHIEPTDTRYEMPYHWHHQIEIIRVIKGAFHLIINGAVYDLHEGEAVYIQDGLRFLRSKTDEYDLIINDATDPFGYTEGLFTKEFYGSCYKALKEDGIMVYQHGSPFYSEDKEECVKMHRKAYQAFPVSRVYQAHIPTCSSGYWLFGFASKKYHPLEDFRPERFDNLNIETWYYTTNLHRGAFMLPKYVEDMLEEEEG